MPDSNITASTSGETMVEFKYRRECPKFTGEDDDYKDWKEQVLDWLEVSGDNVKCPGIEIRMSLNGKAKQLAKGIERAKLKNSGGEKIILKKLDEAYLKDTLTDNFTKMNNYFQIKRKNGESMRDYIIRYEREELECSKAIGKSMLEGEAKGYHVLAQANLSDKEKQMVLSACGKEKLEYEGVSQIMKRIFESLGKKEESDWLGAEGGSNHNYDRNIYNRNRGRGNGRGRGGRNPLDKQGKVSVCVLCGSEWHWARECHQNFLNKKKEIGLQENNQNKNERIYIGEDCKAEDETFGEIDAILDTGCKSTVCGEF